MGVGRTKKAVNTSPKSRKSRAKSQEARENELISLAMDVAEQQMLDGTASAMVITHYLKLGTEKAKLERRQLEADVELKKAKVEAIESSQRIEELYSNAIKAMRRYNGEVEYEE